MVNPERLLATETGQDPCSGPYQIAVLPHDDLCPSNGPDRMNEERGKPPKPCPVHCLQTCFFFLTLI